MRLSFHPNDEERRLVQCFADDDAGTPTLMATFAERSAQSGSNGTEIP